LNLLLLILCLAFGPPLSGAQEAGLSQLPRLLYVGDQGRLVVTLGPELQEAAPFVIADEQMLPQRPDLKLHRLEYEFRRGRGQLLIDFTAFAPGQLELPPISLPQLAGFTLEGCRLTIASALEAPGRGPSPPQPRGVLVLSGQAAPLAAPGTALLIYGTASLIVLILLLSLGLGIWGRPYLAGLLEAHRRRRLIRLMGDIGRGLRKRTAPDSGREILRELSVEFRAFLGYFFGGAADCRAMTSQEFYTLPPLFAAGEGDAWARPLAPSSLGNFFRRLDRLRFSGEGAENGEIFSLLDQMEAILKAMDLGFRTGGK
jgi:hypothetical protein